ncbi:MAG: hypothetical protein AAFQ11_11385 [Pseudomonadota bacterium]
MPDHRALNNATVVLQEQGNRTGSDLLAAGREGVPVFGGDARAGRRHVGDFANDAVARVAKAQLGCEMACPAWRPGDCLVRVGAVIQHNFVCAVIQHRAIS